MKTIIDLVAVELQKQHRVTKQEALSMVASHASQLAEILFKTARDLYIFYYEG